MKEIITRTTTTDIDRIHSVGNLGVGGERGEVFLVDGICPTQSATQYKDPIKVIVKNDRRKILFVRENG